MIASIQLEETACFHHLTVYFFCGNLWKRQWKTLQQLSVGSDQKKPEVKFGKMLIKTVKTLQIKRKLEILNFRQLG